MKKIAVIVLMLGSVLSISAQIKDPVNWKYEATKKNADTYEIVITALLESPWHIYSQNTGKGGPVPTNFTFKTNPLITRVGNVVENGKLKKVYDNNFKTNVLFYSNTVAFVQTVKVKGNVKTNISGTVEYMVCDDEQCLPPTRKEFNIKLQ